MCCSGQMRKSSQLPAAYLRFHAPPLSGGCSHNTSFLRESIINKLFVTAGDATPLRFWGFLKVRHASRKRFIRTLIPVLLSFGL